MSTQPEKKKNYIRERIVPKRNGRRILNIVLATIGLGVLFGVIAGVSFFVSQNVLGKSTGGEEPAPIIIARDDTTAAKTEAPPVSTEAPSSTESTSGDEPASGSEPVTMEPTTEASISTVYDLVKNSLVPISAVKRTSSAMFGDQPRELVETLGVAVAENEETLFILTDEKTVSGAESLRCHFGHLIIEGTLCGTDEITGIAVISVPRTETPMSFSAAALGNSLILSETERVFLFSIGTNAALYTDDGIITHIGAYINKVDGCMQPIYTDMPRGIGPCAALFDETGALCGWVSDAVTGGGSIAVANGISPLKYLIEDLCSKKSTAYLGILCRSIREEESLVLGIEAGLYVENVVLGSPAYEAGIQVGDRLIAANNRVLDDSRDLQLKLDELQPGDTFTVNLSRKNGEQFAPMTLTAIVGAR